MLKLRKKCPYSELFWSVFSPNAGKYGPENSEHGHILYSDFLKRKDLMNRQKHLAEKIFSFYSKLADRI